MSATRVGIRVTAAIGLLTALLASLVPSLSGEAEAAAAAPTEVMVVTANVEEVYNRGEHAGDLDSYSDLDIWVRDLLAKTSRNPDVLLVQEVRLESANYLTRRLSSKSGVAYKLVAKPGSPAVRDYPNKQIIKETGIIINTETMKVVDPGGFFTAQYPDSASAGGKLKWHKHAFLLAKHLATGKTMGLSSVHFTHSKYFKDAAASNDYRGIWARQLLNKLNTRYPARDATIIAGDFNDDRCWRGEFKSCEESSFWAYYTGAKSLTDLLWSMPADTHSGILKETGFDYIFSSGSADVGGSIKTEGADHAIEWAVNLLP